jgi:hypothetical protein
MPARAGARRAEHEVVQDVHGVLAVLAGGVDVAADVEPVLGDVVAGEAAGDFLLGFQGADAALADVIRGPDAGVLGEQQHVTAAAGCSILLLNSTALRRGRIVERDVQERAHPLAPVERRSAREAGIVQGN